MVSVNGVIIFQERAPEQELSSQSPDKRLNLTKQFRYGEEFLQVQSLSETQAISARQWVNNEVDNTGRIRTGLGSGPDREPQVGAELGAI